MQANTATWALLGYGVYLGLAFGYRSWLQWRRTGRTGFVGVSARSSAVEQLGAALFVLALIAGAAAPLAQRFGLAEPLSALARAEIQMLGGVAFCLGLLGTLWAQLAMGNSWRIGVDSGERTALVAEGPFRWVRNPIFSAMLLTSSGLTLLVPNGIAIAGALALLAALEIQVRLVEEPYLQRTHGDAYRRYASEVGRFFPGVGRLPPLYGAGGGVPARSR